MGDKHKHKLYSPSGDRIAFDMLPLVPDNDPANRPAELSFGGSRSVSRTLADVMGDR